MHPQPNAGDVRTSTTTFKAGNITCTVDIDWGREERAGATAVAFDVVLQVVTAIALLTTSLLLSMLC